MLYLIKKNKGHFAKYYSMLQVSNFKIVQITLK